MKFFPKSFVLVCSHKCAQCHPIFSELDQCSITHGLRYTAVSFIVEWKKHEKLFPDFLLEVSYPSAIRSVPPLLCWLVMSDSICIALAGFWAEKGFFWDFEWNWNEIKRRRLWWVFKFFRCDEFVYCSVMLVGLVASYLLFLGLP